VKRLSLLAAALLLAACAPSVSVDAFPTEPDTRIDCKSLYADAPQRIAGLDRIPVDDDVAAAWGDPAVILRCGVEKPADLTPTSYCDTVADIDWLTERTADGYLFTTIGRAYFVSVEVPSAHDPAADVLVDLAEVIDRHDPVEKPCV
jgi:hypothetical protein